MSERSASGEVIVWEQRPAQDKGSAREPGSREEEATVRTIAVGQEAEGKAPVIWIVSSGFGERSASAANVRGLRGKRTPTAMLRSAA